MLSMNEFLEYHLQKSTRSCYRSGLRRFIEHVYAWPTSKKKSDGEKYDSQSRRYLEEDREHFKDIFEFLKSMKEAGRPPNTLKAYKEAAAQWLEFNEIELTRLQRKRLQGLTKGNSVTREEPMDRETIGRIMNYMDIKGRAAVLTMASSGLRPREVVGITLDDIDLSTSPPRILIRAEIAKTEEQRVTFLTPEAREALKAWLKVRESYINSAARRNMGLVKKGLSKPRRLEDNRVFPISQKVLNDIWESALNKASLNRKDRRTNRKVYRLHGLRKFFRTQLATAISRDVVEALMGHAGYLTVYRQHTERELADYYHKGEHTLYITPPKGVVEKTAEVEKGLQQNRKLLEHYVLENMELKEHSREQEKRLEKVEKMLRGLENIGRVESEIMELVEKVRERKA